MTSGGKQEIYNSRERAVSTDWNRTQAFANADALEVLRLLMGQRSTVLPLGGGRRELGSYVDTTANDSASIGTPLRGDVIDGLVVIPQGGSLNLLVTSGVVILDDPDGQTGSSDPNPPSGDDSRAKLVIDPGIQAAGALAITAGAGATRIDVIECRRTTQVLETDNRDVFDNTTGTFVPVNLNKVQAARLVYRVRSGVPGSGLPASVQGWLPLCVAVVPSSATSVDTCDFYDVRPFVKDRIAAPTDQQTIVNPIEPQSSMTFREASIPTTVQPHAGRIMSNIGMYRAGGVMAFDLSVSANWGPGFTPAANAIWYLYAVFPGGLPRWVKYAVSPNPRIPDGPLGVLCVTDTLPDISGINALTNVSPPASTGLTTAGPAAPLLAGYCQSDGSSIVPFGTALMAGRSYNYAGRTVAATVTNSSQDIWRLTPGTHFPRGARALICRVSATLSAGAANAPLSWADTTVVLIPGGTTTGDQQFAGVRGSIHGGLFSGGGGFTMAFDVEVPIPAFETLVGMGSSNLDFLIFWAQSSGTKGTGSLSIVGWRL